MSQQGKNDGSKKTPELDTENHEHYSLFVILHGHGEMIDDQTNKPLTITGQADNNQTNYLLNINPMVQNISTKPVYSRKCLHITWAIHISNAVSNPVVTQEQNISIGLKQHNPGKRPKLHRNLNR